MNSACCCATATGSTPVRGTLCVGWSERRKELDFLPTVSFGSAEISSENVVTVKDRADHNMYRYKKERKAHRMSGDAGEE